MDKKTIIMFYKINYFDIIAYKHVYPNLYENSRIEKCISYLEVIEDLLYIAYSCNNQETQASIPNVQDKQRG